MTGVMNYMHEFYFESAAMILTLITVGRCWRHVPKERLQMLKSDATGAKDGGGAS